MANTVRLRTVTNKPLQEKDIENYNRFIEALRIQIDLFKNMSLECRRFEGGEIPWVVVYMLTHKFYKDMSIVIEIENDDEDIIVLVPSIASLDIILKGDKHDVYLCDIDNPGVDIENIINTYETYAVNFSGTIMNTLEVHKEKFTIGE